MTEQLLFLSTPSARRATVPGAAFWVPGRISIHALREEGDSPQPSGPYVSLNFYPRPPRGGRLFTGYPLPQEGQFLSTPSARRATLEVVAAAVRHFISIHALREEGDPPGRGCLSYSSRFLSTPSARRATSSKLSCPELTCISIHALREEGDVFFCGQEATTITFLSTPSARRATADVSRRDDRSAISIHALREEGDFCIALQACTWVHFYPRPPRGGRRPKLSRFVHTQTYFYPRPPRGGRPICAASRLRGLTFLSTPSARRATIRPILRDASHKFLSTPSARRAT